MQEESQGAPKNSKVFKSKCSLSWATNFNNKIYSKWVWRQLQVKCFKNNQKDEYFNKRYNKCLTDVLTNFV